MKKMTMLERFKASFKVVKDLGGVRRKGVMLESIAQEIVNLWNVHQIKEDRMLDGICGYERVIVSPDENVGIYEFATKGGVPTFKVGIENQGKWKATHNILWQKKLVR